MMPANNDLISDPIIISNAGRTVNPDPSFDVTEIYLYKYEGFHHNYDLFFRDGHGIGNAIQKLPNELNNKEYSFSDKAIDDIAATVPGLSMGRNGKFSYYRSQPMRIPPSYKYQPSHDVPPAPDQAAAAAAAADSLVARATPNYSTAITNASSTAARAPLNTPAVPLSVVVAHKADSTSYPRAARIVTAAFYQSQAETVDPPNRQQEHPNEPQVKPFNCGAKQQQALPNRAGQKRGLGQESEQERRRVPRLR